MDADRAVLVGCSRGGQIAFSAALSIPQRITKLVLIDSAPAGAPDAEAPLPPALAALFDAIDRAEEDDDTDELNRLEAHLWLDGPMQPEGRVAGEARDVFLDMNRTVLLAPPIGDTEDLAGWDRLGDVTQPTLIVAGAFDLPLLVERCRAMAAIVPRARYVELSRSAHLPMLDDAPALVAALQMFLDDDG
jgi:pimeloyl-ACP methyl ester carboxylesterase